MCGQLPIHGPQLDKEYGQRAFGPYSREEVLQIIETGEIIEQYLDDTPYAS